MKTTPILFTPPEGVMSPPETNSKGVDSKQSLYNELISTFDYSINKKEHFLRSKVKVGCA